MKIKALAFFIFLTLFSFAKEVQLSVNYNTYLSENGQTYLEVYYMLDPTSVVLIKEGEHFTGAAEITLMFLKNEEVINFDKLRIPVSIQDTLNYSSLIQKSTLKLDTGKYILGLEVVDINNSASNQTYEQPLYITFDFNNCHFSKSLLLDSYKKAEETTAFSKGGYNLYPHVSSTVPYLHDGFKKLSYYIELYNTTKVLAPDESFVIQYYIKDENKGNILKNFSGYKKSKTAAVIPFLGSFDIQKLGSGNYSLITKAINKDQQVIAKDSTFFFRFNSASLQLSMFEMDSLDIESTFARNITNFDTMYKYLECIYPISDQVERAYGQRQKDAQNLLTAKRFFVSFWMKRNPTNPEGEWKDYYEIVKKVDKKYRTSVMPGYRTDRGRVYLQYGPPYLVDSDLSSPGTYPYEIWQYDQLESASTNRQVNKVFVFINTVLAGNNFQLAHSDAIGELYNANWKADANFRNYNQTDMNGAQTNFDQNSPGSSYNNNIIMGTTNQR